MCGTDFAVRNLWFWGEIFAFGETGNNPSCISLYWLSHPGINSCIMETALKDIYRTAFGDYQCLEGHSRNTIDGSITHCCLSKIYCAPKTCKWMRHLWSDEDFESKVYALNTEKAVPFEVSGRAHSGHGWGRIRCQKYFCFWFFHHRVVSDQDCFFSLFEFFSCFKFTLHSCAMTVYRRNSEGALMSFAGHLTANRFLSCAEYLHHFLLSFFYLFITVCIMH